MQQSEQEIHFSDYLRIIKGHQAFVIIFFVLAVFTVAIGSFLMDPVYRATVTMLIDIEGPNVLTTTTDFVSMGSNNYYAYKEYFQSQKEIIRSRSIAGHVFQELELDQKEPYISSKDPIGKFMGMIEVEPVRDTRLLLLHVDSKDPSMAADIANRIAEVYVTRNLVYITKSEVMNLHKNDYLRLQTKLSEYSKIYKDKHPKMIRLKQEIAQIAARIKEEKDRVDAYNTESGSSVLSSEGSSSILAGFKANNITICFWTGHMSSETSK